MNLSKDYDFIVIGGGCVGSGIALDATLRGYKVLLLEQNDFASGASSKSSKLIHGGVRYLEKAIKELDIKQFNLVKEALKEREIFLTNAPSFSKKIKINIPIYSYFDLVSTYIGLFIYKLISRNKSIGKNSFINSVVSLLFFPFLKKENLKGCISFYDGTFLDTRVVISILQSAVNNGAEVKNYCEVNKFLYENNKIVGVEYFDKTKNISKKVEATVVINATGSNVDNLRTLDDKNCEDILNISSGIHIVVSKNNFKTNEAILIPNTIDKRVIFILPYMDYYLIGTTDNKTNYEENPKVKEFEVEYLLNEINRYFNKTLTKDDILSCWSGIRPLVKSNKNKTEQIVREHQIFSSKNGLISICGGKWTTYRKMSEDLVDYLIKNSYIKEKKKCQTKKYKIGGNEGKNQEIDKLMSFYPISKETRNSLKVLYGNRCIEVLNLANEINNFELINPKLPYLKVEINYCIKNEFVKKPIDFLSRRVGLCFVNKKDSLDCVDEVTKLMGEILFWDDKKVEQEILDTKEYIYNFF